MLEEVRIRTIIAVVGLWLLAVAGPAQAAFPGENGKIAYKHGGTDVYTMNPDGSGKAELADSFGIAEDEPAWSGDGTRLAFVSDELGSPDIWISNPNGTGRVFVGGGIGTGDVFGPAWSPDSNKITYSVCAGGSCSGLRTLTPSGGTAGPSTSDERDQLPTWSPDGTTVAFSSRAGIDRVNSNGTGRTTLTTAGSEPNYSPDAQKIAFTSVRDGNAEIYVMNADGSAQTRLTTNSASDSEPTWSPDGQKIAFTSVRDGNAEIYVMNADGSAQTNLTNDPQVDWKADWQPVIRGYARPKGASNSRMKLVPAFKPCSSPNGAHGAPLALASCTAQPASDFLTVGTPDSNGVAASSTGSVVLRAICNPAAPGEVPPCTDPGDQGDAELQVLISDVHQRGVPLTDYAGELQARMTLRITDRFNGLCDGCPQPGTVTDLPFDFSVPCTTTPGTVGSSCSATTTANSVIPGSVREGKRAIWAVGQFQLFDGGADGDADTENDNTLFAVQGLFAP